MKKQNCKVIKYILVVVFVLLLFEQRNIKASQNNLNSETATSGISVSALCKTNWPGASQYIAIIIHFSPPNTNISLSPFSHIVKGANGLELVSDPLRNGKYFRATNSFCGYIELRNAAGHKIQSLKPEVNSEKAYPDSFNIKLASHLLASKVGKGPPLPYVISGSDAEISFNLNDYYKIETGEKYQLTVWPKIYKRSTTNDDFCERIDLPPVIIPINRDGDLSK